VRVPRSAAFANQALARGLKRTIHSVYRPLHPPPGMTIAELAAWHATAFRAQFAEPVDVMGVSGGGVTALQLALDHPGTVRRLVLLVAASQASERHPRAPGEAALMMAGQTWNVTARLGELTVPVLVIGGERDRPRTPKRDVGPAREAGHRSLPGRTDPCPASFRHLD
jgi:pimeloyl-ACP methyl ester carboxylesterase